MSAGPASHQSVKYYLVSNMATLCLVPTVRTDSLLLQQTIPKGISLPFTILN